MSLDAIVEAIGKPYFRDEAVAIYHADCRDILPLMPPESVDLVLTDPPYGVRADQDWDDLEDWEIASLTMAWLSQVRGVSDRLLSFFSGQRVQLLQALCTYLFPTQRLMIWYKPDGSQYAGSSHDGLWYSYEALLYCHGGFDRPKGLAVATLIREGREAQGLSRGAVDMAIRGKKTGLCYRWEEAACLPTPDQAVVLEEILGLDGAFSDTINEARTAVEAAIATDVFIHRTVINGSHPTEKPEPLIRELLLQLTNDAQTILDPFMGSGTTLRAAKDLGRYAIGIEIEEKYCEIAAKRMAQTVMPLTEEVPIA